MWTAERQSCIFCGKTKSFSILAEEGLIRQALLSDTEILLIEKGTLPGFAGAAALLRY